MRQEASGEAGRDTQRIGRVPLSRPPPRIPILRQTAIGEDGVEGGHRPREATGRDAEARRHKTARGRNGIGAGEGEGEGDRQRLVEGQRGGDAGAVATAEEE